MHVINFVRPILKQKLPFKKDLSSPLGSYTYDQVRMRINQLNCKKKSFS